MVIAAGNFYSDLFCGGLAMAKKLAAAPLCFGDGVAALALIDADHIGRNDWLAGVAA